MLTTNEMMKMQTLLAKADNDQMKHIAEMFNATIRLNASAAAQSFIKGQDVYWSGKRGKMSGKVVKIMQKNVRVKTEDNQLWNVSANILKAA
jgi:hypothetical protein